MTGTLILLGVAIVAVAGALRWPVRAAPRRAVVAGDPRRRGLRQVGADAWRRLRRRVRPPHVRPDDVAEWCAALARRVRSGATLRDAVGDVVPLSPHLAKAIAPTRLALARGRPLAEAMVVGDEAGVHRDLRAAFDVIGVCAVVGGAPAAPLDRVAGALRLRGADERERVAQAAQAKMSAKVLTVVPIGVLALFASTDADVRGVITTGPGAACVIVGLLLNVGGAWWMRGVIGGPR